jgi:hypothetical protein
MRLQVTSELKVHPESSTHKQSHVLSYLTSGRNITHTNTQMHKHTKILKKQPGGQLGPPLRVRHVQETRETPERTPESQQDQDSVASSPQSRRKLDFAWQEAEAEKGEV